MTTMPLTSSRELAIWRSFIVLLVTATAYDVLFWQQDIGVNLPIFSVLIAGALIGRYGWQNLGTRARALLAGLAIACFFTLWHNSVVAIIAGFVLLFLFTAFAHEPELKSIWYAIAQSIGNFFMTPVGASGAIGEALENKRVPRTGWRWFKLAMIPIVLLVVYFQIYRIANPKFDELTAGFLGRIANWLGDFFEGILTAHTLFFLFAMMLSAGLLFRFAPRWLVNHEQQWSELLLRQRMKRAHWLLPLHMNALESERKVGLILLVLMNLLLVVVNAVDIKWIWFGFTVPEGFSLKQFVHEGTWLLIISILLSIAILLRLFKGNQNFYTRSKPMRALAYAWISQNFILGISVFLRNYHYIDFHGLAYKRIGVIVFLALVLVGLVTLYLKIRDRRSFYHLLRVNAWAAFVMLVLLTTINWDGLITRYNLGHWNQGEIDVDNYLAMSDKVLPLLYADKEKVEEQMKKHSFNEVVWISRTSMDQFAPDLDGKRRAFLARWEKTGWQGWNRADANTYEVLKRMESAN